MRRMLWASVFLVLVVHVVGAAEEGSLPVDVQEYIENRKGCNQLAGEDYSDSSRGKMMAQELLECGYGNLNGVQGSTATVVPIDRTEKRLRKKYRKFPTVLQALDAAKDQLP